MRVSSLLAGIACLGLVACSAHAQTNRPTNADLRASLERARPSHPILEASISGCEPGTMYGEAVQVCRICLVALRIRYGDHAYENGGTLDVWRGEGTGVFFRAISAEQPTVAPPRGQRGVWLLARDTERLEVAQSGPDHIR